MNNIKIKLIDGDAKPLKFAITGCPGHIAAAEAYVLHLAYISEELRELRELRTQIDFTV